VIGCIDIFALSAVDPSRCLQTNPDHRVIRPEALEMSQKFGRAGKRAIGRGATCVMLSTSACSVSWKPGLETIESKLIQA
jgi:hypothetical protein